MFKSKQELLSLDDILDLLFKNTHRCLDFKDIFKELNLSEIKGEFIGIPQIFKRELTFNQSYDLISAMAYLLQEGYIHEMIYGYKVSYKGIIKFKLNPFKDEELNRKWGSPSNRLTLIISILSFIIAVIAIFS